MDNRFVNRRCKLVRSDGFVLFGIPREITPTYIVFETFQKTSIIGFSDVKELSLDPKYNGAMII